MTTPSPARVQPGVPTGGQFATSTRSEAEVSLSPPSAALDLAGVQAAREVAQERWRAATSDDEISAAEEEVEALSLRVLAMDMKEQYAGAAYVVVADSDQGDFMDVVEVLGDAGGHMEDDSQWGPEDTYTAAADLGTGSEVWRKHASEVGLRGGERQWAISIASVLGTGSPDVPARPVEHAELSEHVTAAGTLSTFIGDDGVPVVQLDTDGSGRVRINLNDAPVWDGDPEIDEAHQPVTRRMLEDDWDDDSNLTRAELDALRALPPAVKAAALERAMSRHEDEWYALLDGVRSTATRTLLNDMESSS